MPIPDPPPRRRPDLVSAYLRWTFLRAFLHRGWWLVTSIYLIVDAGFGPAQLVAITIGQGAVSLAFEIPAGVIADTVSRKLSLLVSHVLMGAAMLATGLVTDFAAILATQMLWGLSWTFASGADVAWLTDELDQPARISAVLVQAARVQLLGSAAGIVGLGALASAMPLGATMVLAGSAMCALGGYVLVRFPEQRFAPARSRRWAASWSIVAEGFRLARASRVILVVFVMTALVNGAHEFARLYPLRLIDLGFPSSPALWFAALNVAILLTGAAALRIIEARVHDARAGRAIYALGCAAGAVGLLVLAAAPELVSAAAAVILVGGTADPIARALSTIWVNQQATSRVRATMHSALAQSEYVGEIACGAVITAIAAVGGIGPALVFCAVLFGCAGVLTRSARSTSPRV